MSSEIQTTKTPVGMNAGGLVFDSIEALYRFAQFVEQSPFCPKGMNAAAIVPCVQFGMELGLKPMQAVQGIMVVNGRPSVYGDTLKALVESNPVCEWVEETFENDGEAMVAICAAKRRNRPNACIRSFSVPDAKRAKLWGKPGPWTDYPKRMLQMRARSWCLRDEFADIVRGIGVFEEVTDYVQVDDTPKESKATRVLSKIAKPKPEAEPVPDALMIEGGADKSEPPPIAALRELRERCNDWFIVNVGASRAWLMDNGFPGLASAPIKSWTATDCQDVLSALANEAAPVEAT